MSLCGNGFSLQCPPRGRRSPLSHQTAGPWANSRSKRFVENTYIMPLSRIKPRFLGHLTNKLQSLVLSVYDDKYTVYFNTETFYILPAKFIYAFHMILVENSDYFTAQHKNESALLTKDVEFF
jgi:hypothetical protein